jgi:hypothetical protein
MSSKPLTFLVTRFWGSENKQPTWALDARTAAGLLLCILLFSLVGWLYLTQASQMATTGFHMKDTVQQIERLERQNALLRYKIAELETLPRVEARARQLGLGPMTRMTYLVIPDTLSAPQPALAEEATLPESDLTAAAAPADSAPLAGLLKFWDEVRAEIEAWVGKS